MAWGGSKKRSGVSVARLTVGLAVAVPAGFAFADPQAPDVTATVWVDHLTFGSFNTLVGVPLGGLGMLGSAISGNPVRMRVDSTGRQLVLQGGSLNSGSHYSTGMFHHAESASDQLDAHEAGHAHQSAVLGPLYFPLVGINYLAQGHDNARIEVWADRWSDLSGSRRTTHPLRFRFEHRSNEQGPVARVGTNFALFERSSRVSTGASSDTSTQPVTVSTRYGEIDLALGAPRCPNSATGAAVLQASIMQRDFLLDWSTFSDSVRLLVDSHEELGHLTVNFERQSLESELLRQQLGLGLRLGRPRTVAFDLTGRLSGAVHAQAQLGTPGPTEQPWVRPGGLSLTGGVGAEGRLHLLDAVQVFARDSEEWNTDGSSSHVFSYGAETPQLFRATTFTRLPTDGFRGLPRSGSPSSWLKTERRSTSSTSAPLFFEPSTRSVR